MSKWGEITHIFMTILCNGPRAVCCGSKVDFKCVFVGLKAMGNGTRDGQWKWIGFFHAAIIFFIIESSLKIELLSGRLKVAS